MQGKNWKILLPQTHTHTIEEEDSMNWSDSETLLRLLDKLFTYIRFNKNGKCSRSKPTSTLLYCRMGTGGWLLLLLVINVYFQEVSHLCTHHAQLCLAPEIGQDQTVTSITWSELCHLRNFCSDWRDWMQLIQLELWTFPKPNQVVFELILINKTSL